MRVTKAYNSAHRKASNKQKKFRGKLCMRKK